MKHTKHWADGHRVYNGCPDSTMQKRLDSEKQLLRHIQEKEPTAHVTYFPNGEFWMGSINWKLATDTCSSKQAVLEELARVVGLS